MAQTRIDCCNSALQKLGAVRILNFTDTKGGRECGVAYDSNRRSELRNHPWAFATKRVQLSADSTAPAFGFLYQYTLPSDCVKVLLPNDPNVDWVVEGGKLLTNWAAPLNLRYTSDVDDETKWDPAFYDAMAVSLAIDLCETMTNSTSKKATLDEEYKAAVNRAKKANAFEQLAQVAPDPSFITVRL
jgi:hypothetical protein